MSKFEEGRILVENHEEIKRNIKELIDALASDDSDLREKAIKLVKRGHNFIACLAEGGYVFAPSRFAGYKDNNVMEHGQYFYNDGKETDPAVSYILGRMLTDEDGKIWQNLEDAYLDFCDELDIEPENHKRKYWLLNEDIGRRAGVWGGTMKLSDVDLPDDAVDSLTEGQLKRVKDHLRRERNPKVRQIVLAQDKYSDCLSCDMCGYEHERTESRIEEAQFEAHHNIPIKQGERNTDLKDISLLCSNCHRLIHRLMIHEDEIISPKQAEFLLGEEGISIYH